MCLLRTCIEIGSSAVVLLCREPGNGCPAYPSAAEAGTGDCSSVLCAQVYIDFEAILVGNM